MSTIDQLQIEISASSKRAEDSINRLIGSLKKLDTHLNLNFGDSLSSSLANLNLSLSTLSTTISSFDSGKLKDISKSFRSLSRLSVQTTSASKTVDKDLKQISSSASRFTQDIAKKFNITDKNGLSQLQEKMAELESGIKKGIDTNPIEKSIEDIVKEFGQFGEYSKMAKESFLDFKNAMRQAGGFNLHELGSGWMREFANPERARGIFGIRDVRNDTPQTVEEFVEQFNDASHGKRYTVDGNPVDTLVEMANDYDRLESDVDAITESEYRSRGGIEAMAEAMAEAKNYFRETKDESQGLAQSLTNIPNLGEKLNVTGNVDGLETIILNLRELVSLDLSPEKLSGITTLANAMGKLGGKSATGAAASIKPIAEGLKALPQNVPTGEQYAQLASGLAKLGGVKVQSAAGLKQVAEGLEKMKTVGEIPNIKGLTELGQSLSVFGRKTAQNAIAVIPQLATAFRNLIQVLSTAPTISQKVIDLANAMANLTANTSRSNGATNKASNIFGRLGTSASRARKSFGGLAATIGKIYATYWLLFRAFGKIREAISFGSDLVEVQNVVDTVFGDAKSKVEDFADSAIMSFGLSELSAKKFASKYQAMGAAMGITNAQVVQANEYLDKALEGSKRKVDGYADSYKNLGDSLADMSINMTKLTADISSFYNMDYDEVATKMTSIWTGQTRPMREFGVDLTQATLQEWMLTQGIDGNIKKMTQAQKTMIRYQYVMSQLGHVMNDYARTADTWANVTRTIGEQFRKLGGIVGTGFINAFRPALVRFRDFMNTMIDLVEKGLNAIGKLLGWQIEISEVGLTEDADAVGDIADGLGDAAGNAKKLNEQLMGFDRLNNITTPKDSGGSGSGSGATGGGGGASDKATDPKVTWKKYESEIKSWWQLGDVISKTAADALENIDWKRIRKNAESFGKNLADLMNGLFASREGQRWFEAMGTTIAETINTVMTAAKTWSENLEWSIIGRNIRKGLEKFLKTWEPKISGRAVAGIVRGIAQAVYTLVSNKETWHLLGSKIAEGITAFLESMNEVDEYTGLTGWEALGGSIASVFSGIGETISTALSEISWDEALQGLFDGINQFIKDLTPEGVATMIGLATIGKIPGLIKAALSSELGSAITVNCTIGILGTLGAIQFINADDRDILSKVVSGLTAAGSVFAIATRLGGSKGLALKLSAGAMVSLSIIDFFTADSGNGNTDLKTKLMDTVASAIGATVMTGNAWAALVVGVPLYLKAWIDWAEDATTNMSSLWDDIQKEWGNNRVLMVGLDLINDTVLTLWTSARNKWGTKRTLDVLLDVGAKAIKNLWKAVKEQWGGKSRILDTFFKIGDGAILTLWLSVKENWGTERTLKVLLGLFAHAVTDLWTLVKEKWGEKKTVKVLLGLWGGAIATLWTSIKEKWGLTKTLEVGLKLITGTLDTLWKTVTNAFKGKTVEVDAEAKVKGTKTALGGAFYNDRWHNIAQFASGGRPSHGTMFVAGEAGAEVVGHIGGRSEVLNESQMASVMYDAVSDAMATQNAILIKQNQLLSGILAKDYGISSSDIFAATQREANNFTMRTGRPAFN